MDVTRRKTFETGHRTAAMAAMAAPIDGFGTGRNGRRPPLDLAN